MVRLFFNKLKGKNRKNKLIKEKIKTHELNAIDELNGMYIDKSLEQNLIFIKKILGNSNDVIIHPFISAYKNNRTAIVYINGLVDKRVVNEKILGILMNNFRMFNSFDNEKASIQAIFQYQLISVTGIEKTKDWRTAILSILSGDTALLIEGSNEILIISTKSWEKRNIEEPISESTVRGPHEGFTETILTNTALIRRKLRDPFLRFDGMKIGLRSQTEVVVAYIEGLTNEDLVREVKKRLKQINIDRIIGSTEVEHLIEDNSHSIYPQINGTERPDVITSALLDGQIAIFVDNSPYVLVMPYTFNLFQISSDDYYERWQFSSIMRIIRLIATIIVITGPGLYICLTAINPELLPTNLLISTASARSGVPFPVTIELLLMEFTLELLREAGVRLPKPVGQTVSIVGALVLGDAAISANIVSPLTVIVVSITAISSFAIPSYPFGIAVRISRFPITIISSFFGLLGWILGIIFLLIHLVNLKSFNVPYLTPFSPLIFSDLQDSFIIKSKKLLKDRPKYLQSQQVNRSDKPSKNGKGEREADE